MNIQASDVKKLFLFSTFFFTLLINPLFSAQNKADSFRYVISLPLDSTSQKLKIENFHFYPLKKPRIALVLSGGGARGFVHLGVIKALQEYRIPINLIVGTSIGSIIGGFYAAGFTPEQIRNFAKQVNWNRIFTDETYRTHLFVSQKSIPKRHLLQLRFDGFIPYLPSSLSQGQKILNLAYQFLLKGYLKGISDFDRLQIPFRAVATDLISGKRVVLSKGDLAEAITASMSIPLLFAPMEIDGMWLVDGGIVDNLPVDVAKEMGADFVIAVDATSPLRDKQEMQAPWEIADQVTTIMMRKPTAEHRRMADFLIKPDLKNFRAGDFSKIDSLIDIGYFTTLTMLDSLNRRLEILKSMEESPPRYLGKVVKVELANVPEGLKAYFEPKLITRVGNHVYSTDIKNDLRVLYQSGYFQNVTASIKGTPDQLKVIFECDPFPPVKAIRFRHHNVFSDSLLQSFFPIENQKNFNIHIFKNNLDSLRNFFIKRNYPVADFKQIKYNPQDSTIEIQLDEGLIDDVRIVGNQRTRKYVILREFTIKPGEVFTSRKALDGIQNIYSTGLFDRVSLTIETVAGKNILFIKVKEKKYLLMRLGAHASFERKSEAFLEMLEDNLLGTATKFSLFASIGELIRRAEVSLYTFRLFNTYLTYRLSYRYQERWDRFYPGLHTRQDYRLTRRGIRLSVGQQIARLGLISAEFRAESIDVYSADAGFPFRDSYRVRAIALRSVVDRRDRLPFPERGIYNRWYWESGNQLLLGSSFSYTKIFLSLEGYYTPIKNFTYHPFFQGGSADITLPFSEFFSFGGQNLFPGSYNRELLGRQFILTGVDFRWRLPTKFPIEAYLKTGYTIGAMWSRPDDRIDRSDFNKSFYIGFAMNSLLGPIQLVYGNWINRRSLFYFSLGYDF